MVCYLGTLIDTLIQATVILPLYFSEPNQSYLIQIQRSIRFSPSCPGVFNQNGQIEANLKRKDGPFKKKKIAAITTGFIYIEKKEILLNSFHKQ